MIIIVRVLRCFNAGHAYSMSDIWDNILSVLLSWQLYVALALVGLSVLPVRHAYRMLRTGNIWQQGATEDVFLSSLLVALAAAVFPYAGVAIIGIWIAFARKHLLRLKPFLASLTAIVIVALYYAIYVFFVQNVA